MPVVQGELELAWRVQTSPEPESVICPGCPLSRERGRGLFPRKKHVGLLRGGQTRRIRSAPKGGTDIRSNRVDQGVALRGVHAFQQAGLRCGCELQAHIFPRRRKFDDLRDGLNPNVTKARSSDQAMKVAGIAQRMLRALDCRSARAEMSIQRLYQCVRHGCVLDRSEDTESQASIRYEQALDLLERPGSIWKKLQAKLA